MTGFAVSHCPCVLLESGVIGGESPGWRVGSRETALPGGARIPDPLLAKLRISPGRNELLPSRNFSCKPGRAASTSRIFTLNALNAAAAQNMGACP